MKVPWPVKYVFVCCILHWWNAVCVCVCWLKEYVICRLVKRWGKGGSAPAGSGSVWLNQWDQLTWGLTEGLHYIKSIFNPPCVFPVCVCTCMFVRVRVHTSDQHMECSQRESEKKTLISPHGQETRLVNEMYGGPVVPTTITKWKHNCKNIYKTTNHKTQPQMRKHSYKKENTSTTD